ncbi:MAG: flagellar motor switch protein FliN [Methyloversatilis sp.]|jgi:flagellar motor switch protein FliN|uniref:flagellar motor switch protein FliN n=1 Tax=Methyloversatilis TaxID=378210 RepID=UPI000372CC89|nr:MULTISPECIES: flagellar motor switch protein FliN [Methyloversatilis]MBT9516489.1 flagellar motor switch protein FliN [Methyloversatilis discipulorum]MCR6667250.1 flagellar motor switch protein FliN [Methyloversatilis sp.]MDY0056347.1 flagellar motor switch protein FliN [Methyloversatilis sp.]PZU53339.1 MAG: flagellar motor switch protein FliN [Thauera sp.]
MSDLAEAEEQVSDDDWAAAMAEQTTADEALAALDADHATVEAQPANIFQQFGESANKPAEGLRDFEMILDIPVQLTVELGRTKISIRNLLQLGHGSVVELDGMAGEPMDVLVNGTLIAQGEVVVVNDKFGIRLTDIITPAERMKKLKR